MNTVLIVDDDSFWSDMVKVVTEKLGYATVIAENGLEANYKLTSDIKFVAVITDTRMEPGDGLMVLELVAAMDDDVRPKTLLHSGDAVYDQAPGRMIELEEFVAANYSSFATFRKKGTQTRKFITEFLETL